MCLDSFPETHEDDVGKHCECHNDDDVDEQPDVLLSMYFGVCGSEVNYTRLREHEAIHLKAWIYDDPALFLAEWCRDGDRPYDDVAELCGGEGHTVVLLVRRGFRNGQNFDLACGYNLSLARDRKLFK